MTPRQLTLLIVLAALWGASFLFIAETVDALGPIGVADARVALAAAALLVYAALTAGVPVLRDRWRDHLLLGAANVAIPFALISAAELELPASLAAILNATAPLGSAVIAAAFLGQPLRARQWTGLVVAFGGVGLVVGLAPLDLDLAAVLAVIAVVLAAASYAVAGHLARARFAGVPPLTMSIGQLVGATILLTPLLAVVPPRTAPSGGQLVTIALLGLACTAVAYLIYFRLIAEVGATSAITVTYLVPVFGVAWGTVFRDEELTAGVLVGAGLVLAGVLLVTRPGRGTPGRVPSRSVPATSR
jgi:drug/metabolite transporter (DMT)-like permease